MACVVVGAGCLLVMAHHKLHTVGAAEELKRGKALKSVKGLLKATEKVGECAIFKVALRSIHTEASQRD